MLDGGVSRMIGLASDQWRTSWLGEPILDCGDLIALFPENDVSPVVGRPDISPASCE